MSSAHERWWWEQQRLHNEEVMWWNSLTQEQRDELIAKRREAQERAAQEHAERERRRQRQAIADTEREQRLARRVRTIADPVERLLVGVRSELSDATLFELLPPPLRDPERSTRAVAAWFVERAGGRVRPDAQLALRRTRKLWFGRVAVETYAREPAWRLASGAGHAQEQDAFVLTDGRVLTRGPAPDRLTSGTTLNRAAHARMAELLGLEPLQREPRPAEAECVPCGYVGPALRRCPRCAAELAG